MKKSNPSQWHVNKSQIGMGDFYGTGIRQKIGRMRDGLGFEAVSPTKLKKPPRSLA